MKAIFLDIDGVMNSQAHGMQLHELYEQGLMSSDEYHDTWDLPYKKTLEALAHIVNNTGAEIILSSTWRLSPERIQKLNECFNPYGFQIKDKTCHSVCIEDLVSMGFNPDDCYYGIYTNTYGVEYTTDRGAEIAIYLREHPEITKFVILDDDIEDIRKYFPNNYVETDFYEGDLDMNHAVEAIRILEGDNYE